MRGADNVIVTVAVLAGTVLCQLGEDSLLLESGSSHVFAGELEDRSVTGAVQEVTDFTVTLAAADGPVVFRAPKNNKLIVHEVGQLRAGDEVTIRYSEEEGRKFIRDIDGSGAVAGLVTARGDAWIEVKEGEKPAVRFRAPWRGGNPQDGGGPDRDIVRKIAAANVGSQVELTWAMPEGKRIVALQVRERGSASPETITDSGDLKTVPAGMVGLHGRVIGRLVSVDAEQGSLTLEIVKVDRVWKNNKAKNPQSAEGRTLKVDGVFGKFLDVLLTLKPGDGVQIEVKHISGDGLTFLGEGLSKVDLEESSAPEVREEQSRTENETTTTEAPRGMNGFRGMLVGQVVSKDIEQGVLVLKLENVKRVWPKNKAPAPAKSVGQSLTIDGISGKFLDTLLILEPGDHVEVDAAHISGNTLRFPGEWLKKVE